MVDAVKPPTFTSARPCMISPLSPSARHIGIMATIVVRVVIRIGRSLVAPASISAVCISISRLYWFTVSTYRIPLFTTVPTNIRNPSRDVMLMVTPVSFSSPKEPTRLKGMVVMTMKENFGTLEGLTLAYCGQGRNNVQNSLMITSAILGVNYVNATPAELEPDPAIVEVARAFAAESGATITVTNDPVEAVENADAIYTNVWAAMGEESQFAERVKLMSPYQVNAELLSHVKNPDYIFLHCLPAFHNAETEYAADMAERFGVKEMEVTDEVFYSDHGRQFQQAENRMHTIKAIMAATLGDLYIPCV